MTGRRKLCELLGVECKRQWWNIEIRRRKGGKEGAGLDRILREGLVESGDTLKGNSTQTFDDGSLYAYGIRYAVDSWRIFLGT